MKLRIAALGALLVMPLTEVLPALAIADTDLAVYYLLTPTPCAKKDQKVTFYPYNSGDKVINGFEARVYKNGEFIFSEQVNQRIQPGDYVFSCLEETVHFEYDETADVSLRVVAPDDAVADNDSTVLHFTMPKRMDYPFTWTAENSCTSFHQTGVPSLDWQYDAGRDAYYMSGRATNWMGTLSTDALEFPEGEPVKCSFEFGTAGGDVTLYFVEDYGDNVMVTDTVMVGHSTEDFSPAYFSFRAQGPAVIHLTATLGGEWNAEGAIFVRNICFTHADKDLVAKQILSPVGNSIAVGGDGIRVAARFQNPSPEDIEQPVFCYDAGFGVVREVYAGTIGAGKSLDYTFEQSYQCQEVGTKVLKVWCEAAGDSEASNDMLQKEIEYYDPLAFPYATTFDDDIDLWTPVDANGDCQTFDFLPMARDDMAATYYNYAAEEINDWLISPAIRIPAGTHRVDFNYACYLMKGDVNLKLYMGTSPDVTQMTELLFDQDLFSQLWQTGYHLINVPADDVYYFAFWAKGRKDAVVIDNFKVDDGEDLGITDLHFGTISGYNLTTTTVTVSFANFGISPQQDVTIGYSLNQNEYIEETVPAVLQPGDTVTHTFQTLADVSELGATYWLEAMIMSDGGDEDINDYFVAEPLNNTAPQQLPYFSDFSDEERNAQWLMQSNHNDDYSGWRNDFMANSYSPMGVLKHENWSSKRSDSWAYSEGILMEKGTYEVSYFHHEAPYWDGPNYRQSFEAWIGQERTPEGMTIEVNKLRNVDVYGTNYEKIIKQVEIPEDGIYFLGFHNTSAANDGMTIIDDISIEPVKEGMALPYASNFAGADSLNWTFYNPNPYSFLQWTKERGTLIARRTSDDAWTDPEGMVVSPKLHLEANKLVNVTLAYDVTCNKSSLKLALYSGTENNAWTMKKEADLPQDQQEYTVQIQTGDEPQELYFGFRTNTKMDGSADYSNGPFYTVKVSSIKVEYDGEEAIAVLPSDPQQGYAVYDLEGRLIGCAASKEALGAMHLNGIYLVQTEGECFKVVF